MSSTIRLVQNDTLPVINLTLKDKNTGDPTDPDTWDPIDLSDPTTTVYVYLKKSWDSSATPTTITCTKVNNGQYGECYFKFPSGSLDEAGLYYGEIEIDFNGETQTAYDKLKFRVREQTA